MTKHVRHRPDRQPSKRMLNFDSWADRLHEIPVFRLVRPRRSPSAPPPFTAGKACAGKGVGDAVLGNVTGQILSDQLDKTSYATNPRGPVQSSRHARPPFRTAYDYDGSAKVFFLNL